VQVHRRRIAAQRRRRHPDKAFRDAQEHCEQYGKSAKLTNREVHDKSDDPVLFECV